MSEPKTIGQVMLDIAANPQDELSRFLRHCPCVQAALIKQGKISLSDLSDKELDNLADYAFLEDWIDNQDVMQKLHIGQRTLQKLRTNGTLSYTKLNGKIYYLRQEIEALLKLNYRRRKGQW